MGKVKKQLSLEIRQLPLTLAKLMGGLTAVIGFSGVIFLVNGKSNPAFSDILPYLFLGIFGVVLFWLSTRFAEKRVNKDEESAPTSREKRHISMIAWAIFVILIALFGLVTFIINR